MKLGGGVFTSYREYRGVGGLLPWRSGRRWRVRWIISGNGDPVIESILDDDMCGLELLLRAIRTDESIVDTYHRLVVGQLVLGDDIESGGDERPDRKGNRYRSNSRDGNSLGIIIASIATIVDVILAVVFRRKVFGFGNVRQNDAFRSRVLHSSPK